MPKITNLLPGDPEPLGRDGAGRRDQLRRPFRGGDPDRAAPVRQHRRPAGRRRSSRCRPRRTGRGTSGTSSSRGCPTGRSTTSAPTARTTRPATGRGSTSPKTLLDPYAPAVTGDFYWQAGDALGYDNTDPDDPDRHLRPSAVAERRRRAAVRGATAATSTGRGTATPTSRSRSRSSTRSTSAGFTRHHSSESDFGGHLPRVHREDPLPEGAGDHRRRAAAGHGVRPASTARSATR